MTGYHRDMEQDVRIASAFVQNEWKMNVLTMLVGARLDKHNLIDKLIFSPASTCSTSRQMIFRHA